MGDSMGVWIDTRYKDVKVSSDRHNQQHNNIVWFSFKQEIFFMYSQRSREEQSIEMLLIVHAKYGCVFLMFIAEV